jgi:hypothetical protein
MYEGRLLVLLSEAAGLARQTDLQSFEGAAVLQPGSGLAHELLPETLPSRRWVDTSSSPLGLKTECFE